MAALELATPLFNRKDEAVRIDNTERNLAELFTEAEESERRLEDAKSEANKSQAAAQNAEENAVKAWDKIYEELKRLYKVSGYRAFGLSRLGKIMALEDQYKEIPSRSADDIMVKLAD